MKTATYSLLTLLFLLGCQNSEVPRQALASYQDMILNNSREIPHLQTEWGFREDLAETVLENQGDEQRTHDGIIHVLQTYNQTHPEWVRKLASNDSAKSKIGKMYRLGFPLYGLSLEDMRHRGPELHAAIVKFYEHRPGFSPVTLAVAQHDTLQVMAKATYGSIHRWPEIYLLNNDKIKDFDRIYPNQEFVVYTRNDNSVRHPSADH